MVWRLTLGGAKAAAVRETEPGDVLLTLRMGQKSDVWLRLAEAGDRACILQLTGQWRFNYSRLDPQNRTNVLVVGKASNGRLEIREDGKLSSPTDGAGELHLTDQGAYIVAKYSNGGFLDECYISLADWSVVAYHEAGERRAAFSTWRLVEYISPTEKQVLLSAGSWDQASP